MLTRHRLLWVILHLQTLHLILTVLNSLSQELHVVPDRTLAESEAQIADVSR
jgi:hypothetical protein